MPQEAIITRRLLLSSLTGSIAYAASCLPARAFFNCDIDKTYVDELPLGLERTFWFPLGPQDRKTIVYVVVAPWCPVCHQLYKDAKSGKIPFSLRAIPTEPMSFSDKVKISNAVGYKDNGYAPEFFDSRQRPMRSSYDIDCINTIQRNTQQSIGAYAALIFGGFERSLLRGFPYFISNFEGKDAQAGEFFFMRSGSSYVTDPQISSNIRPYNFINFDNYMDVYNAIAAKKPLSRKLFLTSKSHASSKMRVLPLPGALPWYCGMYGDYHEVDSYLEFLGQKWFVSPTASQWPGMTFLSELEFDVA